MSAWERQGDGQYQHDRTGAWLEDSRRRTPQRWSLLVTSYHDDREATATFATRREAELFHDLMVERSDQWLLGDLVA